MASLRLRRRIHVSDAHVADASRHGLEASAKHRAEPARTDRRSALGVLLALLLLALSLPVLPGCDDKAGALGESITLNGKRFTLELAADPQKRFKGLSERTEIPADGGMLFVFPKPGQQNFVMRDCFVDIDIIYADPTGLILTMHEMKVESPRGEGEGKVGETNQTYENRLKRYPSRYSNVQFVIELRGGTIPTLGLKEGDRVGMDVDRLKKLAR